jgi:hypothetical protein
VLMESARVRGTCWTAAKSLLWPLKPRSVWSAARRYDSAKIDRAQGDPATRGDDGT